MALKALSLEVSPLHALFVQYAVAGLPAEARLRFTLETPTLPLIQEETAPQGQVRFPLERPGRYLLRLEALTAQGSHRLAERPFTYQPTYALTLWHDEGGPYQLSDLSGRTLTQGYLPQKRPSPSP
jgi:hypothetical protein